MLPWMIAAVCAIGFIWLWFTMARKELTLQRDALDGELIQLEFVREQLNYLVGTPHEAAARERLKAEENLYRTVQEKYILVRRKPMNRFPAWVFGFPVCPREPWDTHYKKEAQHEKTNF